jgi:hypothetical protein
MTADRHLKRLASQIFGQLPEDSEEARMVLRYLEELMAWQAGDLQTGTILRLVSEGQKDDLEG